MRVQIAIVCLALVACGGEEEEPVTPEPAPEEAPPDPTTIAVALHEWGVIDVHEGAMHLRAAPAPSAAVVAEEPESGSEASAMEPSVMESPSMQSMQVAVPMRPMAPRAPVIYAHVEGEHPARFDLTVRFSGTGRVLEHYPGGGAFMAGDPLVWEGVDVLPGECEDERTYPSVGEPGCRTEDQHCEAALGETWETDDGACLRYGDTSWDHLFYRGELAREATLPLTIQQGTEAWTVHYTGEAPLPGSVYRVDRAEGTTTTTVVAAPATGARVELAAGSMGAEDAVRRLHEELVAQGLTTDEADAFLRQWREPFFGAEGPERVLLYWIGGPDLDRHMQLEVSDNVTISRAMLVRVILP